MTALVTYAAPALAVTIIAARLPLSGRVVLGAVVALVAWRLLLQGLGAAVASEAGLSTARYGLGLGGAALAVATLVLVAGFVSGARSAAPTGDDAQDGRRPASGRMVALGVALGTLGAAGVSLLHGTWDAYWRTGAVSWIAPVLVGGTAVVAAWLLRRDAAAPGARGLWVLGPYLALGIMVFGNPRSSRHRQGSPPVAGGTIVVMAFLVSLPLARDRGPSRGGAGGPPSCSCPRSPAWCSSCPGAPKTSRRATGWLSWSPSSGWPRGPRTPSAVP
ncbi:hypothetical protein NKG05_23810 [Oerskovia sp. M15]